MDSQRATDLLEPEHSLEAWNQSPDSQHASEIVFVDSGVQDYETLVAGFRDGVEVLVIEGTQDGVSQIAKTLEGRANLDAIHLVSHGSVGSLQLGFTELSSDSMTQYADALSQIGSSLTDSGDLILYGCDVAQGEIGQAFISALATATDADVAASNDRTGDVGLSGDWVLESSSGDVGTAALIDETVTTGYAYVLAQPTVLSVEVSDTKITDSDDGSLFTVAVTFDQAMNTGGSFQPTLTFDPDVLLAGTMINPSAGAWSVGDTVFTKTFDVVDVGVEVTSIEIDVTGALNSPGLGGEAQADYTAEPEFDIDTLNPTVVVNIVESQLNDGDPSSLVTFEFSEGVTGFDANDLSAVGGSISDFAIVDTNTYTALFTASDGVAMTGSVTVTGGYEDQSGNAGVSGDDTVVIDRVSPTVMSVVRANADYTNAGTVDFTVTFSEDVAGVDVDGSDFRLVASVVDATIESVSGSNSVYTVTVSTGTTGGVIGLVLGTVPTIQDAAGNDLTNSTVSGVNQDYTIASTEVLLVDGDVFVADIREATADDLTLSVVGGDLVISSASGVIAAGMGVSRINDSSVSVALNDVTGSDGVTVTTGGLDDTVTIEGVERRLEVDTGDGIDTVQLQANAISTNGGDLLVDAEFITQDEDASIDAGTIRLAATGGDVNLNAAVFATRDLEISASGDVAQTGFSSLVVAGDVTITANVITLDNASNDFAAVVNAVGTDLSFSDANDITLGTVFADGGLTVVASAGKITGSGSVQVTGQSVLQAAGEIRLINALNGFVQSVDVSGTNVELKANVDLVLGEVDAATLDLEIVGSISQDGSDLSVAGDLNLVAVGNKDLTLDSTGNLFGGTVTVVAFSVVLVNSTGMELGDFDVDSLEVTAGGTGDIVQVAGSSIDVRLAATFIAAGDDVLLDSAANVFVGAVSADAEDFILHNSRETRLGLVEVDSLLVDTHGTQRIVQDFSGVISVSGDARFVAAGFNVTLDENTNDFAGTVSATGTNVVLGDANSINLGEVVATTLDVTAAGNGDITQTNAGLTIAGTSAFTAGGDIIVDQALNQFGDAVSLVGVNAIVVNAVSLILGEVELQTLSAALTGGDSISQNTVGLQIAGNAMFSANGEDVVLGLLINDFQGTVSVDGHAVSLGDRNSISLGEIVADSLAVKVSGVGYISQVAGGLVVQDEAIFVSVNRDVVLLDVTNVFNGTVSLDGNDVSLVNSVATQLDTVNVRRLDVVAAGDITQGVAGLKVVEHASFTAVGHQVILSSQDNQFTGPLSVSSDSVDVTNRKDLELGLVLTGALDVVVVGASDITQDGSGVVVSGDTSLLALRGDVTLQEGTNDFQGVVNVEAKEVELTDQNAIQLGSLNSEELHVTALGSGSITQDANGVNVLGLSKFVALGNDVQLGEPVNEFNQVELVAATAVLTDASGVRFRDVAVGDLTLTAGGAVSQIAGAMAVAGDLKIDAVGFDVTLDQAANDFAGVSSGGSINVTANDVEIEDLDDVVLGDLWVTTLSLETGGDVSQKAGTAVVVNEAVELSASGFDITLSELGNDFVGDVVADGKNVVLSDQNDVFLFDIDVDQLLVVATGHVTDGGFGDLLVAGNANLVGGEITLGNDAGNSIRFGSLTFNSTGAVSVAEDNDMNVSGVSAAGEGLDLWSSRDLLLAGSVDVVGDATLSADDITVDAKFDATGNVLVVATGDIDVNEGIDPTTVTLQSNDQITINAAVVAGNLISVLAGQDGSGGIVLTALGSIETTAGGSDVVMVSGLSSGQITLAGKTTAVDQIQITSSDAAINGAGLVTADTVDLNAVRGIGNATGLELSASNISANTTSGDLRIDNLSATTVNVTSLVTGSGSVEFDQVGGGNLVTGGLAASDMLDLTNAAGDIALSGSVSGDGLVVTSSGAVTDGVGGDLAISSLANVIAGSIELGNDVGNVINFGSLTFSSVGLVAIGEDSSLNLVGVNTAGSADIDSTGTVSDTVGGSVDVAGLLDVAGSSVALGSGTFNAGSLIFNSVGSVAIAEDSSLLISGPSNAGSGLDLFATADVTLDGAVTVSGDVDIVAGVTTGGIHVNAKLNGTGAILLDAADEITINAGIDPTAVVLKANDDITVNASVVAADLISVSAGEDGSGGFTLSLTGSLTTTDVGSDVTVVTGSGSGDVSVDGATTGLDQVVLTSLAGALNGAGLVTGDVVDLNAISGIGNTTGLMLSARNASADTTLGDIAIDNVSADAVSVTSLVTGSGAIEFDQSGGGEITFAGPVSSGGLVNGGPVKLTASAGLIVDGVVSTLLGVGGTILVSGATLNGAVTVGAGDVVIQGGSVDLLIGANVTSDGGITLTALRDVIVAAVVDANNGGSITVAADSNSASDRGSAGGGHGGARITSSGQLNAEGDVTATGSDLFATAGQVDSVLIDADGVSTQVLAVGNVLLTNGGNAPSNASVIINGVVRTTGVVSTIGISAEQDVELGELGDIASVDGAISITADANVGSNGGAVVMVDGVSVTSGTGEIDITADGNITLSSVSTGSTSANAVRLTTSNGAVVDAGDSNVDVIANGGGLVIQSATGVGDGNAVEVSVALLEVQNSTAGSIQLAESDDVDIENLAQFGSGDILFDSVAGTLTLLGGGSGVTGNANVRLAALVQDALIHANVVSGTGNIALDAGRDLAVNSAVTTGSSGTIYLRSGNNTTLDSQLTSDSGDILVDSAANLTQTASITSNSGDVGLVAGSLLKQTANGDVTTGGDVLVSAGTDWTMAGGGEIAATGNVVGTAFGGDLTLGAISGENVALTASGSIIDANAGLLNVTADSLSLRADGGLIGNHDKTNGTPGQNANAIDIAVDALAANSDSGIYISESDSLVIATVAEVAVDIESVVRVNFNGTTADVS
ncbi:DUF4347 domain-containing protein, partial [bacterium]|nr:DUF4347 domain-containing protein [bacterium]